jgi:hypothetical protein
MWILGAVAATKTMTLAAAAATAVALAGSAVTARGQAAKAPVFGPVFSPKVVALCKRALAQKKAEPPFPFSDFNPTKPDVSKLPAIGRYEAAGVRIFRTWLHDMRALGLPPRGRIEWAALIDALRAHLRIIAHQQAAALRRDGEAFTRDYYAGNAAQRAMVSAANAAGVPICATAAGA